MGIYLSPWHSLLYQSYWRRVGNGSIRLWFLLHNQPVVLRLQDSYKSSITVLRNSDTKTYWPWSNRVYTREAVILQYEVSVHRALFFPFFQPGRWRLCSHSMQRRPLTGLSGIIYLRCSLKFWFCPSFISWVRILYSSRTASECIKTPLDQIILSYIEVHGKDVAFRHFYSI